MEIQPTEPSLQEALRQIDWDTDFAALFEPSKQPTSPPVPPANPFKKRPAERIHTDEEERTELAELLRDDDTDILHCEWKAIAERQRAQRYAAAVENNKLRRLVESELETSRRIAALASRVDAIGSALGRGSEPRIEDYLGPQLDVQTHLGRLDGLLGEAQSVFCSGKFAENAGRDFRDIAFRSLGEEGFLVELTASWALPFHVEDIVLALWTQTTRVHRAEKATCFEDLYAAEGTLVSRFVSEPKELGTIDTPGKQPMRGASHGQIATRRGSPRSDGSVVLVSNMEVTNFKPDGGGRSLVQGYGFLLVEPLKTHNEAPACRVKWCRRMQGRAPDASAKTAAEYSKWVHALTSHGMRKHWWFSIDQSLQAIENNLFDASQTRRASE